MIPDGWSIDQFENGNIMFSHPQHGGLCIAPGNAVHALCTALRRSEQERSEEARDAARMDALGNLLATYDTVEYSLASHCRCGCCWSYRIKRDDTTLSEEETLRAAIDAAMAKGDSK